MTLLWQQKLCNLQQLLQLKNRRFHVPQPTSVSPGDAPATITQNVAWMERQFNACQTPRSMYLSVFNSFRVIRCLSQCVSPKIAFLPHFGFPPGDAPGAIMLNVVWMESEFDAYKLSRSMYPSIFNSFPVIRTASAKIAVFTYRSPHFCPCDYHAICCTDGKKIQCLPNPSQHVIIIIN